MPIPTEGDDRCKCRTYFDPYICQWCRLEKLVEDIATINPDADSNFYEHLIDIIDKRLDQREQENREREREHQ